MRFGLLKANWGIRKCRFVADQKFNFANLNDNFMSIYDRKVQFVAGLVFSMALINLFKLIPYFYLEILNFESLLSYLLFSPIAVIGVILGHWMNSKLSDKSFFAIINFFIVVASGQFRRSGALPILLGTDGPLF